MQIIETIGTGIESVYLYAFEEPASASTNINIKIGRAKTDVIKRIKNQQASMQTIPVVLLVIKTNYSKALESYIHEQLRNEKLDTFGKEWFLTNLETVKLHAMNFIGNSPVYSICRSNRQIGHALRFFRTLKNLTQMQLSDLTSMAQSTISDVEKGKVDVSMDTVSRIMTALDIELVMQVRTKN